MPAVIAALPHPAMTPIGARNELSSLLKSLIPWFPVGPPVQTCGHHKPSRGFILVQSTLVNSLCRMPKRLAMSASETEAQTITHHIQIHRLLPAVLNLPHDSTRQDVYSPKSLYYG